MSNAMSSPFRFLADQPPRIVSFPSLHYRDDFVDAKETRRSRGRPIAIDIGKEIGVLGRMKRHLLRESTDPDTRMSRER